MKNIHVISTDKPSRLWMTKLGNLTRCHDIKPVKEALGNNVNIYITNDEEIKKGDWYFDIKLNKSFKCKSERHSFDLNNQSGIKKIILTTDQDLINDGVQSIPYDFLISFVKNPNYEDVKIESEIKYFDKNDLCVSIKCFETDYEKTIYYPIMIPKEIKCYDKFNQRLSEGDYVDVQKDGPHQIYKKEDGQLYFKPYGQEDKVSSYFSNDMVKCDSEGNWITNDRYEELPKTEIDWSGFPKSTQEKVGYVESKQETLEEAFERIKEIKTNLDFGSFYLGTKWQQNQDKNLYSEEEVIDLLQEMNDWPTTFEGRIEIKEWFQPFKKK